MVTVVGAGGVVPVAADAGRSGGAPTAAPQNGASPQPPRSWSSSASWRSAAGFTPAAGGLLDADARSDYGTSFELLLSSTSSAGD
ncbi:hypothetical protein [Streptomyces sp. NPDC001381]|uniref:hypothetical protein n=1 Tax=Streptomyces sp. NPDC001381 TaxID=3364567 RepID=UPI00368A86D4